MARFHKVVPVLGIAVVISLGCLPTPSLTAPKGVPPGPPSFVFGAVTVPGESGGIATMGLRWGIIPHLNLGLNYDSYAYRLDMRYQLIGDPFPLDIDVEAGAGIMVILPFTYTGVAVGVSNDRFAAYVRYRYCGIETDTDDGDHTDTEDDLDIDIGIWWAQIIIGAEIKLGGMFSVIPEYTIVDNFLSDDGAQLDTFTLGFRVGRW